MTDKLYGHLSDTLDSCCAPSQPKIVRDLALDLREALAQLDHLAARHAADLADLQGLVERLQTRVQELTPPEPEAAPEESVHSVEAAMQLAELCAALDEGEASPVVENFSLEGMLDRLKATPDEPEAG